MITFDDCVEMAGEKKCENGWFHILDSDSMGIVRKGGHLPENNFHCEWTDR